eukprot:TRINITY_DN15517_c1_g1_i7.p1 TRINITY_DN15517_c1_g1~~TRINITY_DN15517_c1_g1_i7.p1  ORF type:complete len:676 (+),score=105.00 TRINITY_DN15517_c1_g1_i7:244-2271(+)
MRSLCAACLLTWIDLVSTAKTHFRQAPQSLAPATGPIREGADADQEVAELTKEVNDLKQLVGTLVKSTDVHLEPGTADARACSHLSGSNRSRAAMAAQGWQLSVSDTEFQPQWMKAWMGGPGVGTLRFKLHGAGRLSMRVGNKFVSADPRNLVTVRLNGIDIASYAQWEEEVLCLQFSDGDQLEIAEVMSIIYLADVQIICQDPDAHAQKLSHLFAAGRPCRGGQSVRLRTRCNCNTGEQQWTEAVVQEIMSENRAIIKYPSIRPNASHTTTVAEISAPDVHWQVPGANEAEQLMSTAGLLNPGEHLAPRCAAFEAKQRGNVGVAMLATPEFQSMYAKQIQSITCYARSQGYDLHVLNGAEFPVCKQANWFFKKHCMVAKLLELQTPGYSMAVIDSDVIAFVFERGLEYWLQRGGDLQFYERGMGPEVAAGNYIAKNKPWVRNWLMGWTSFDSRMPKGYSSADNGAIHVHLVETLQLEGAERCAQQYAQLTSKVENLHPYFAFINCTKTLLGPPRHWQMESPGEVLTIWPRFNFFVDDGVYVDFNGSSALGPIMHHGIKSAEGVGKYKLDLNKCARTTPLINGDDFGERMLLLAKSYPEFYPSGPECRGRQCAEKCMPDLSCPPLENNEEPAPKRRQRQLILAGDDSSAVRASSGMAVETAKVRSLPADYAGSFS